MSRRDAAKSVAPAPVRKALLREEDRRISDLNACAKGVGIQGAFALTRLVRPPARMLRCTSLH